MNIGIDISQVVYEGTGVGRFTKGLIEAVLAYDSTNHWVFFFSALRGKMDAPLFEKIKKSRHRLIHIPLSPFMLSFLWNTLHIIPIETFTGKLDLFICSDWTEPPATCKKATVIHDLSYIRYPETVHPTILKTQKRRMKWVQKESTFVITPSHATKDDVISTLSIPQSKVTPLYSGVEIITPNKSLSEQVINKFNLSKPFILSVGKIEPRKNIGRLIEAFRQTKQESWDLIIVGPQGWDSKSKKEQQDNIRFTGYVSEEELHALYKLCAFFVYPSVWEGFGYPVIEAMAHKKAVATSNNSSLKELVDGHGILFDPLSVFDISASLSTLMYDEKVRKDYEQRGYKFAQQFTWKRYYEGLMNIFI